MSNLLVTKSVVSGVDSDFAVTAAADAVFSFKVTNPTALSQRATIVVENPVAGLDDWSVSGQVETGTVAGSADPTTVPFTENIDLDAGASIEYEFTWDTSTPASIPNVTTLTATVTNDETGTNGLAATLAALDPSDQVTQHVVFPTVQYRRSDGTLGPRLFGRDASGHRSLDETAAVVSLLGAYEPSQFARVVDYLENGFTLSEVGDQTAINADFESRIAALEAV